MSPTGLPRWHYGKKPTCPCRRPEGLRFDPCIGKIPGGGHGSPLQHSCLENPMDGGAQWATVHGVSKSWVQLKWLSWNSLTVLRLILAKRLKSNSSYNCGFFFFLLPCWSVFTSCVWKLYCFVHTCIKLYVLKMSWQFYHYSPYSFILGKCFTLLWSECGLIWIHGLVCMISIFSVF